MTPTNHGFLFPVQPPQQSPRIQLQLSLQGSPSSPCTAPMRSRERKKAKQNPELEHSEVCNRASMSTMGSLLRFHRIEFFTSCPKSQGRNLTQSTRCLPTAYLGTVNWECRFIREMRGGKDELPLKMHRFIATREAERRLSYKKVLEGQRGAARET